jgi:hypothetical protein
VLHLPERQVLEQQQGQEQVHQLQRIPGTEPGQGPQRPRAYLLDQGRSWLEQMCTQTGELQIQYDEEAAQTRQAVVYMQQILQVKICWVR